jgi:hypothetical protein
MFFVFIEFDGDFGRNRMTRGFTTAEAREAWASQQKPCQGEEWSDYEEWEAPQEEWPHVRIVA